MEKDKHLGLRIDSDTHRKLKSIANSARTVRLF